MDDPKSEAIKLEMARTRLRIADKLETLEEQVVEPTAAAVSDTVAKVKEAVDTTADAVQSTVQKVQETFDLAAQVQKYPCRMMAASVASGFLLAHLLKASASTESKTAGIVAAGENGQSIRAAQGNGFAKSVAGHQRQKSDQGNLGHWTAEISRAVMHSLSPVWSSLFGAALAQLLPHSTGVRPDVSTTEVKDTTRGEWTSPDSQPDQAWGGRLRSSP